MIDILTVLLWVALSANPSNSGTRNDSYKNQQITTIETSSNYQQDAILSKDYSVAKNALDNAVLERDETTIRLGLKNNSLIFKKDVVQAIKQLYYQAFVPDLIKALEENQAIIDGGSEMRIMQNDLTKAIVSALKHLTGLTFPNTENLSQGDIQKILEESREWYQVNELQIMEIVKAERLERQQETPILSKNYSVAKLALNKAILEKDKSTILLGLNGFSLLIKRDAVQAIKQFNDKSFVPNLIKALDENQGVMSGGSETEAEQQELNKGIILALKQLTGLEFSYLTNSSTIPCFSDCPSKDILRVLKESREWWKKNQSVN
ncbi:MAG TPA: hypothetical protein PKE69_09485 [Pyrinomonadaceae bacterium]|nr:hypothetical protein [Pyrinomonadaceae bacterium]